MSVLSRPRPLPPIARMHDPITSHLAAESFTKSGRRQGHVQRILLALGEKNGQTAAEIAARLGLEHVQVARRMAEIEASGKIHRARYADGRARVRDCKITGQPCVTWRLTTEQTELRLSL